MPAIGWGASSPTRGTPQKFGPVSARSDHRAQVGADLSTGQSPAEPQGGTGNTFGNAAGKRLWKRRSLRELGNQKTISTFPQPRRRRAIFGYISNVSTNRATVTFRNGLTGSVSVEGVQQVQRIRLRLRPA